MGGFKPRHADEATLRRGATVAPYGSICCWQRGCIASAPGELPRKNGPVLSKAGSRSGHLFKGMARRAWALYRELLYEAYILSVGAAESLTSLFKSFVGIDWSFMVPANAGRRGGLRCAKEGRQRGSLQRNDIHGLLRLVRSVAFQHANDGCNVAVVAAVADDDVIQSGSNIVGGV